MQVYCVPASSPPAKAEVKEVVVPDAGGIALVVTAYSKAVADPSVQLIDAPVVVIPVAFRLPGAIQPCGVKTYTCPEAGFVIILLVAATELMAGDALLLFNDR